MENLNVKVEEISSVAKKMLFEIPYEKVKAEMENAYTKLAKVATIKGFRKGKAPRSVLEKNYSETVKTDVTDHLINESYSSALSEYKISPVGYPVISDVKMDDNKPFTFEVIVEVKPSIQPKDYQGMELQGMEVEPTEEEIEHAVGNFLDSKASMKSLDDKRPAVSGDWVDVDIDGSVNGEKRTDLSASAYVCQLGVEGGLLEDLDKAFQGMSPDEQKEIVVKYPKDYHHKDLKGREVTFNIKLRKLMERIVPELSDDLFTQDDASKNLGVKNKEEFLAKMKENLKHRKEDIKHRSLREQMIETLLEDNKFEVPVADIERRLPEVKERFAKNLDVSNYQHGNNHHFSKKELEELFEKHDKELRMAAENDVRLWYIISSIAEKESISASSEEIKLEIESMSKAMNMEVDKISETYGEENLRHAIKAAIMERKTFDFILNSAKIDNSKKETKE
jgi:trigger factor